MGPLRSVPQITGAAATGSRRGAPRGRSRGQPEARGAHHAEAGGEEKGHAVAAGDIVEGAPAPGANPPPDPVAEAQRAVDAAELAAREELRRHGGDDGPARPEAGAEEE